MPSSFALAICASQWASMCIAPATVTLLHTRNGSSLTLSWDPGLTGYALESSPVLPAVQWEPVPSVQNNSVTVDTSTGLRFYRLKKQ